MCSSVINLVNRNGRLLMSIDEELTNTDKSNLIMNFLNQKDRIISFYMTFLLFIYWDKGLTVMKVSGFFVFNSIILDPSCLVVILSQLSFSPYIANLTRWYRFLLYNIWTMWPFMVTETTQLLIQSICHLEIGLMKLPLGRCVHFQPL